MKLYHDQRSSRPAQIVIVSLFILLVLASCFPTEATPQPARTPIEEHTPQQTISQDTTETTSQDVPTVASDPLLILEMELPTNWKISPFDPVQSNSLSIPDEAVTAALTAVRGSDEPTGTAPTLIALKVPRHGLSLDDYIKGVTDGLNKRVNVKRAGIRFDVRADGLPVGVIEYGNETVSGYQIVQFDTMAENLILLTFTAPTAEIADYQQEFDQIAAAIHAE